MPEIKQIHFDGKLISRNKGQSVVASAAYRSGEKIHFEREGITFDYTRKKHIVYSEIFLPEHAPDSFHDRATLWNAVENFETTKNAQLARSIEFSLPSEIPLADSIQAAREMADYYRAQGMCVDLNIHNPKSTPANPHCHLLLTLRPFNEDGTFVRHKSHREYILDKNGQKIPLPNGKDFKTRKVNVVNWDDKGNMEKWRSKWAKIEQRYLEQNNCKIKVEHRSFQRQGIHRIATIHMGPDASAMERKGIHTRIGELNREIRAANEILEKYDKMEFVLDRKIEMIQRHMEVLSGNNPSPACTLNNTETNSDERTTPTTPKTPSISSILTEFQNNRARFILDNQIHQRLVTKTRNLKSFTSLYTFLTEHKIESIDELTQTVHKEKDLYHEAIQRQHQLINEQKRYAQLLDAADAYKPFRKYYKKYESLSGKEKTAYRERYASEIEQAELRLKAIRHLGGSTLCQPSKWKEALDALDQERKEIDAQITASRENLEKMSDLMHVIQAVQLSHSNNVLSRTDKSYQSPSSIDR